MIRALAGGSAEDGTEPTASGTGSGPGCRMNMAINNWVG